MQVRPPHRLKQLGNTAAWRRQRDRLLRRLPLSWSLTLLEYLIRLAPPPRDLMAWGQLHASVPPARAAAWARRARWGLEAGELLLGVLNDPRRRNHALRWVEIPACPTITDTTNHGVVLVTAHAGPPKLLVHTLPEWNQPLLLWTAFDLINRETLGSKTRLVDPVMAPDKAALLVDAALHLRRGGLLLGAPDVDTGHRTITKKHWGMDWSVSLGLPALIRRLNLPTYFICGIWRQRRLTILLRPLPAPASGLPEQEWVDEWVERYWDEVKPVLFNDPANLRPLRWLRPRRDTSIKAT